uniref:THO complex subunit 7 homolog n=1 Tax=Magallana gigas TaxID=29159 RepID=A0A8W8LQP8_MAGGI|nr:THO complex subunit 7 homolog [Crassostrea gigas]
MAVNDDEVIKRRLLYEGDGGSDDKRINSLMKTFIRWCNSTESPEENSLGYERMMASLTQCEYTMEKSLLVYNMNTKEQENYNRLSQDIESKIQEATEKISECKNELSQAKRIRKNRQEYDALARVIQQHPDRQETTKQLQGLDKDVSSLEEQKKSLEQKLDLRRKQFHVLIAAIHELESILDEDETKEGEGTEKMDTN